MDSTSGDLNYLLLILHSNVSLLMVSTCLCLCSVTAPLQGAQERLPMTTWQRDYGRSAVRCLASLGSELAAGNHLGNNNNLFSV